VTLKSLIKSILNTYIVAQIVCFGDQQLQPFATRRHILYAFHHNAAHFVNLLVHTRYRVHASHFAKASHLARQHLRKFRIHRILNGGGDLQAIRGDKLLFDLVEEQECSLSFEILEIYN
jgi:hypothetical protein